MVKLSVIVPCYNEQATILTVLESVRKQHVDQVEFEVIVIDDGSTDNTVALLHSRPELYDKLIACEENKGKGAAVRMGIAAATGSHILFQDADLEYHPDEYPKLLKPVVEYDADLVFGSRLTASPCTRVAYFWHKVGNNLITFIFNIFNNTTFTDVYSCYLLIRRELVANLPLEVDGWAQQAEILGLVVPSTVRMYEVPISYYGRTYEEGKKIRWHHAAGVIGTIVNCKLFRTARPLGFGAR